MNYQEAKKIYMKLSDEQLETAEKVFQAYSCLPMTGRYGRVNKVFAEYGSEYALFKNRLKMEMIYLKKLCKTVGVELSADEEFKLDVIWLNYSIVDFFDIKNIESTTRHDVKAVEYFIREKLKFFNLERLIPYVHMGLTSEDVNNIAYALMMKNLTDVFCKKAAELLETMRELAYRTRKVPMLGHTHGQPATGLTYGLSVAVDWARLAEAFDKLRKCPIKMKCNGAVGNKAAMKFAYPEVDWEKFEEELIKSFGEFERNPLTTQIESHDYIVRILNELRLFLGILESFGKNIEDYTMLKYLKQIPKKGEVGSSTMPQKINPIDAENSWSNSITAAYSAIGLTAKLPLSKLQRDLSDSSTLRTIPNAFLHAYQAVDSMIKMLGRIEVNHEVLSKDLANNPEIISEAIQTIFRKNGYDNAYEIMKEMTRGKQVALESMRDFIRQSDIREEDKARLLELTPESYIGNSVELTEKYCAPSSRIAYMYNDML